MQIPSLYKKYIENVVWISLLILTISYILFLLYGDITKIPLTVFKTSLYIYFITGCISIALTLSVNEEDEED